MVTADQIDYRSLIQEARSSEQKESYRVVEKTKQYRVGIGVRISASSPSFFLEVIVHPLSTNKDTPNSKFTQHLVLLKTLQKQGYSIICQEETCTVLEKISPKESISIELMNLKTTLYKTFQD
jgi:hypothetical protein